MDVVPCSAAFTRFTNSFLYGKPKFVCLYLKLFMKLILLSIVLCGMAPSSKAQNAEALIKNYLLGFEKKDWNIVAEQFTDDFTFTSPAGDDHISLAAYK